MNIRALLELMRVSNLPTVWSNVVMGIFAGGYTYGLAVKQATPIAHATLWLAALSASGAMSLMYCGGMALNDVLDVEVDRKERPGRPIPSGRVGLKAAMRVMMLCFGFGLLGMTLTESFRPEGLVLGGAALYTLALLVLILAYNKWHHASAVTVVLMGLCRAAVVVSTAAIFSPTLFDTGWAWRPWIMLPAAALVAYTVLISVVARREVDPERGGFGGPKTVMNMIAAMPLLDATWLVAMGFWPASLVCVACAGLTKLGHRRIAGS